MTSSVFPDSTTNTDAAVRCTDCAYNAPLPSGYDHIHVVDQLPRDLTSDTRVRHSGYAVEFGGAIGTTLVFFRHKEPALVFGRSGRMSSVISSYGVLPASQETHYNEDLRRDVRSLYLVRANIEGHPSEEAEFARWVAGVDPASAHWRPHDTPQS